MRGVLFLWSCIFLRADDTAVENNFDDKSVNATILGDGNAVSVDLSHSGSVAGKGFSGDGHTNPEGPFERDSQLHGHHAVSPSG